MSNSIIDTTDKMRQQGAFLVKTGREMIAAGEQQISAADRIDAMMSPLLNGSFEKATAIESRPSIDHIRPLTAEVVLEGYPMRIRSSVTVGDAAEFALTEAGQVMDRTELYKAIIKAGAACAGVSSMVSVLGQDKRKRFVSAGNGLWDLAARAKKEDAQQTLSVSAG